MEILNTLLTQIAENLGSAIGAAIGAFAVYAIHKVRDKFNDYKKKKENSIPNLIQSDMQVYQLLTQLLIECKADRAFVVQFHNGTYYVNQGNQMKASCTHEIVKDGIARGQDLMQDMLVSRMAMTIDKVLRESHSEFIIFESDDVHANPNYFFQVVRDLGVAVLVASPMAYDNVVEGVVFAAYLNKDDYDEHKAIEDPGTKLGPAAQKIGFILRGKH